MPYFPKDEENSVTLTLKNGDTVTLIEKQMSVADRKAMFKRLLSLQYDFKFKQKRGEDIDRRIEEAGLNRSAFDSVADEGIELIEGVNESLVSLYATMLAARFESWDVFASRADFEASRPVELTRDAIIDFADAKAQNLALIDDIVTALKLHGEEREKNVKPAVALTGNGSIVTAAS